MDHRVEGKDQGLVFKNVAAFFNSSAGLLIEEQCHGNIADEIIRYERRALQIGGHLYELTVEHYADDEALRYEESWTKNGKPHREGGPAMVTALAPHSTDENITLKHFYHEGIPRGINWSAEQEPSF